jgi:aminopeptidase N
MPIPLRTALLGAATGENLTGELLILLDDTAREVVLDGIAEAPVLSINRRFSAPVVLETNRDRGDLAFLSAHDDDPFARYEAMQQLMIDTLVATISGGAADHGPVIEAVARTLADASLDSAFIGETVLLPSEAFLGDQMLVTDPVAIRHAREALRADLGRSLIADWRAAYARSAANRFEYTPSAKGARRLRSVSLGYIAAAGEADWGAVAWDQFETADNMTDRQGALGVLVNGDVPERERALAAFYDRYRQNPLVLDKWFTTQALSIREDTVAAVEALAKHPDFTFANPNRIRALVGAFAANQYAFHEEGGRGYRFLADMILAVDRLNPQTAARLVPPLGRWRRMDEHRAALMRVELERIVASSGLSKDVFEQASKSLA